MKDDSENNNSTRHESEKLLKINSAIGDPALTSQLFWTIKDVSKFSGYSTRTIYNMTSKGGIPVRRHKRKIYFIPQEIIEWIESGGNREN